MGNDVTGGAYGLTANPSGSFNGSAMTLFYGPSTWPSLSATLNPDATPCWAKHGPGCTWDQSKIWANVTVTANGGVPQAGDIGVHKAAVAELVKAKIPDPDFVRHPNPFPLSPWDCCAAYAGAGEFRTGSGYSTGSRGARCSARTTTRSPTPTTTARSS